MSTNYNIYCDESCHLEFDHCQIMLLGTIWCRTEKVRPFSIAIKELKEKHRATGELKWVKVSKSREAFYLELVDWFFDQPDLHFRCLVVDDKLKLNHQYFNQGSHDSFYYKMYYSLLTNILFSKNEYRIFLDMKDTKSQAKINKLKEILCAEAYKPDMVPIIQHIRSHESVLMQLADFLIGAVSYKNRNISTNETKLRIIDHIVSTYGIDLGKTTPPWEDKFNLFFFSPRSIPK